MKPLTFQTPSAVKTLPVVEIFGPTVQGEGSQAGQRTMFIRLGYCDGAGQGWCSWCDSMFAVDPANKASWKQMTPWDIFDELERLALYCNNVTISGGNPALHDLTPLVNGLKNRGYVVNVETQGTIFREWMHKCDSVTVSPKPPSAGSHVRLDKLDHVIDNLPWNKTTLKIPVDPNQQEDYDFARAMMWRYPQLRRYLSVVTYPTDMTIDILNRYKQLIDRVCADKGFPDVAILPQIHVLVWGHRRGV